MSLHSTYYSHSVLISLCCCSLNMYTGMCDDPILLIYHTRGVLVYHYTIEAVIIKKHITSGKIMYTIKPVYNGHSKEPDNMPFMSSCLYMQIKISRTITQWKNESALYRQLLTIKRCPLRPLLTAISNKAVPFKANV